MVHQIKNISLQLFFVIFFALLFMWLGNFLPDYCQQLFPNLLK